MKRLIVLVLLLMFVLSFAACGKKDEAPETVPDASDPAPTQDVTEEPSVPTAQVTEEYPTTETGIPEDFSFSLVYGIAGDLTYDSESGELVKQRVATRVEDYTTTFFFTDEQKQRVYDLIVAMNPASYPDEYNPIDERIGSEPSYEIVLTVTYNGVTKRITCHNIAIGAAPKDEQGEKFLAVLDAILEILVASDEWQALPEYEFLYA